MAQFRVRLAQRGWGMSFVRERPLGYSFWFMLFALSLIGSLAFVPVVIPLNLENCTTIFTFALIGLASLIGIYTTTYHRPFTLASTHWVFVLFFFFYAPLVQYITMDPPIMDNVGCFFSNALTTNLVILGWCFFVWVAYRFTYDKRHVVDKAPKPYLPPQNPDYVIVLGLVLFSTAVAVEVYGLSALTTRYSIGQAAQQLNNTAVQGIIGHFCRAVPIISLILVWINYQKRDVKFWAMIGILAACSFLTDDPISVARFWAGTLGLGVIGTLLRRQKITGLWLPILLVLGMILVMPVLNLSRRSSFSQINWGDYSPVANLAQTLDFGDFDAYQMLSNTIYMPDDQISLGWQWFGNTFYILPRNWWPNKPGGSGAYVANYYGLGFTDLCEPLPAEGYVNFGFPGVVVWALIFGWFLAYLDRLYWSTINRPDSVPPKINQLVYPFNCGLVFYMMRGDYSASFQDMSAFILATWGVMWLAYPMAARRRNNRFFAKRADATTIAHGSR